MASQKIPQLPRCAASLVTAAYRMYASSSRYIQGALCRKCNIYLRRMILINLLAREIREEETSLISITIRNNTIFNADAQTVDSLGHRFAWQKIEHLAQVQIHEYHGRKI